MKRLIPALACIAAALWLSAGSFFYIGEQTERLTAGAEKILENGDGVFDDALELCGKWKRVKISFASLLKHSDADELGKYFILIEAQARAGHREELLETAGNCRAALLTIREGEKPVIANIF